MATARMHSHTSVLLLLILLAACGTIPHCFASQIDIAGPSGSGAFGTTVTALPNGNFVVTDPNYSIPAGAAQVGAVYLYDGATLTIISTLTGSTANDKVGDRGITVLTNGNFVVSSSVWRNNGAVSAGAVTWGSAITGVNGPVSTGNSLVGSTANDSVGYFDGGVGVTALTNGNYVVLSPNWNNPVGPVSKAGAATWGNGNGGTVGLITSSNSLVGGTANDQVGYNNLNGTTIKGVAALTNGNYVVASSNWTNPTGAVMRAGAATWGNGTIGTSGFITAGNSLFGSQTNDNVGGNGVTALTNGNYVVASSTWSNGALSFAGAVTWGNGSGGTAGPVALGNSLAGGKSADQVGHTSVTALTNGNYVVASRYWNNGALSEVGAVTWGNGTGGTIGLVSPGNSLVGSTNSDYVGFAGNSPGVTALTNGNYVVASMTWTNSGPISRAGAVTWGNGSGGTIGVVSVGNSLVGGTDSDLVGSDGVTALSNGNYVVRSASWHNPAGPFNFAGAATWGSGTGGTTGLISSGNSLIGGKTGDSIGADGVTALTNGNYVVASRQWTNPAGPIPAAGAATWGNGTGGTIGLVTPGNSLVGGSSPDFVGAKGVTALPNGNYVVVSPSWKNAGAVTWGNGVSGTTGLVTTSNSLVGSKTSDLVGINGVTALTNGQYVVLSTQWNNTLGAVSLCAALGLTTGVITAANSVRGTVAGGVTGFSFDYFRSRLCVGRAASNIVTIFAPSLTPDHLKITAPATATAGTSVPLTVTVQDAANATVTDFTGTVHFTSTDIAAGLPADYTFVAGDQGVHAFNVTLNTVGSKTVTATDTVTATITGSSGNIQVNAAPLVAHHFNIIAPATATAGTSIQITVTAQTAGNATVTGYTGTVHFTSTDGAAALPGDYTFIAADNGSHTFNLILNTPGTTSVSVADTVTATITGNSGNIQVSAPPSADHLEVSLPVTSRAGESIQVVVTAQGAANITASDYTGTVHFTSSDGAADLPGDYTFLASDNGVHVFNLTLHTLGAKTVTATDTATAMITGSASTQVNAHHLKVTAPASAAAAASFQVTVTAQDAGNNTLMDYAGTVHFTSNDLGAVLPANYTFVGGDNGVHTFDVTLKSFGIRTVSATDTLASAITGTSSGIQVNAHHFKLEALPTVFAGVTYAVNVTARNALDEILFGYTGTVLFTSSDGAAILTGSTTFVASNIGGRLIEVKLNTLGPQTVSGSDSLVPGVTGTSDIIQVVAPPPLVFTSAASGTPNPAGVNQSVSFIAAATGGIGALSYSWDFGDASGLVVGSSVTHMYVAAGTYQATVTVIDANMTGSNSSTVTVLVRAPLVVSGLNVGDDGYDSDGDGFSDSIELAYGFDPLDSASLPTGTPITEANLQNLTVSKAQIKLDFHPRKTSNDSISFEGTAPVPNNVTGFEFVGQRIYIDVGGNVKTFRLNAIGSDKTVNSSVKFTYITQDHIITAAKFTFKFLKGRFRQRLGPGGLKDADIRAVHVMVPLRIILNGNVYQELVPMSYKAKRRQSGLAKLLKAHVEEEE